MVLMITVHPPPPISPRCTDLTSDVHSCIRTQQKGRSIGVIIDRSERGIRERSAPIDSLVIALQPLCCCVLIINYETLQGAAPLTAFRNIN